MLGREMGGLAEQIGLVSGGRRFAWAIPGQRVVELKVGGKEVVPSQRYTLATLDYLARGGSSYLPLRLGERICLDGKGYTDEHSCPGSPLLSEVIESAVKDGSLDAPLAN